MNKKNNGVNRTNFDRLASDLTNKERKDMLNKVNPTDIEIKIPSDYDSENKKYDKEKLAENKKKLTVQFKKEPVLKKFFVWVKSFLLNVSVEEVYNNAVVSALGRRVEVLFPRLLDYKHRLFCNSMHRELCELQLAQDYFLNQLQLSNIDSSVYYYLLCQQLMPEWTEKVKKICDPFQLDFSKPQGQETRNNFLNKLDETLASMENSKKEQIGAISQSFEWLKMFTRVSIGNMLNKFSVNGENYTCMFVQIKNDFSDFLKVLCSKNNISDELISSLVFALEENKDFWKPTSISYSQEDIAKIIQSASSEISIINIFCQKYPLRDIGKIINENSLYAPEVFSPGDNWFAKYREQWRIVFDQRWRLWNKEYKKEEVKKKIKVYFGLTDLQKFPYHPWKKYENEFQFRFDLTLGFVNYYYKQEYLKYASILDVVSLEGNFQIAENRHEFTDLIADYNELIDKLDVLVGQVALGGEYGAEFMRYESSSKSKVNKEKLKLVINDLEEEASSITELFVTDAHKFSNLTSAMLGEFATVYYGPLTNLNKIMGRENSVFRETLTKFAHSMKYASEIMASLKEIDFFRV